jgi:catechol 2,3-dioxygenase-like lactoylglutathione lyase family enzyme
MNFPFSHVTLGVNDVEAAKVFYDAVLGELGIVRRHTYPDSLGYGLPDDASGRSQFWVMTPFNGEPANRGNGWHFAFEAKNRAIVDSFYKTALKMGALSEGEPGLRPLYHDEYYSAYIRDPEGNKIQAVNHGNFGDTCVAQ